MNFSSRLLAFCFAGVFVPGAAGAATELTMQDIYPPAQTQTIDIIKPWTESFAQKTNDAFSVHHFPVSSVVEITEAQAAIKSGMLDMGMWAPAQQPKNASYAYLLNLPFAYKNARHGTELAWNLYETYPEVKKDIDDTGELLAMWVGASFGFCSTKEPIISPANIKGKRVLVLVPGDSKTIEAWGGIPVYVTPSDAYVGLQRGMGEVCFVALPYMKGLRLMEVTKSVTEMPVSQNLMILTVNRDLWNDLSDEERAMLKAGMGREFSMRIATSLDEDISEVNAVFKEHAGEALTLTPEQRKEFVDAAESLINPTDGYWVKHLEDCGVKNAAEWMKRVYAMSESIPVPPPPAQ